jgi:hypothetical protein
VKRHAGRVTLGILCGCLVGVAITVVIVLTSEGGGNDGTGWAWLDVVRIKTIMLLASTDSQKLGLRHSIR